MFEQHPPANKSVAARPFQFSLRQLLMAIFVMCLFLAAYSSLGIGGILLLVLVGCIIAAPFGIRRRVYMLVFGPVSVCLFALLMLPTLGPHTQHARELACRQNLREIGIALDHYHHERGRFPAAFIVDENGKPMHSWRALILRNLGEQALYDQYDFSEPWDGPQKGALAGLMPYAYACPNDKSARRNGTTNYLAIVGPGTPWSGPNSTKLIDLPNGASNTIMVVEVVGANISWLEPRDLYLDNLDLDNDLTKPLGVSSPHPKGANVLMADGSVRFLTHAEIREKLRAMVAPSMDTK